jgi:glycogen debranching enzyme
VSEDRSRSSTADPADIFEQPQTPDAAPIVVRATDLTGVHVLKHDNLFMLSNAYGDVQIDGRGLGLYDGDTRMLSTYELRLNGIRPVVLRAGSAANYRGTLQLTNPDYINNPPAGAAEPASEIVLRRHSLGMVRERVIADGFGEKITVVNYTTASERARLTLVLDADYADIFELRGVVRSRRGKRLPNRGDAGLIEFGYRGLDDEVRRTFVRISPEMAVMDSDGRPSAHIPGSGPVTLELDLMLEPSEQVSLRIDIWTEVPRMAVAHTASLGVYDDVSGADVTPPSGAAAAVSGTDSDEDDYRSRPSVSADEPKAMHRAWRSSSASIETMDVLSERALERASADLRLLLNSGPGESERYVAAGVPWFSCLFGRDSIITSLQLLCVRPQVARNTLSILARLQATDVDEWRDAQPGKILHELREGELANASEIPHSPYYGTVDATPLWLMLLDEYERWTGDDELVERLWPNAMAAIGWMDTYGDVDGDGLMEYQRHSLRGLTNQGWKDSGDAIRNADGTLADGPIALVEVQGYAYAARRGIARLARLRGDEALARSQEEAAENLRVRFEETFWMEAAGIYAMALDGAKQPVTGIASNAGHALWTGVCSPERAASVARVLTSPGMWSGWGIRTLSSETIGYNPIGYHLGTIWPHDNGICAAGFARYGLIDEARLVAGTLLEATVHFREARLPELFCGFERERSPMPVPYPVACSPQAWAAGSLFHLVSSTLGMRPNAREKRLELYRPALPASLPGLRIRNLRVGEALVDLEFGSADSSISVEVLRRTGDVDVVVRL